jgi:thiol-disulfide isomerase/thioredoxin
MKKLFLLLSLLVVFAACNDTTFSYKITGQLSSGDMDRKTVYLENFLWYLRLSDKKVLDSAVIQNGKFEFVGKADSSYIALLNMDNQSPFLQFFIEKGNIHVEVPDDINKSSATGTTLNDRLKAYNQSLEPTRNKITELVQYARSQPRTDSLDAEVSKQYDVLSQELLQTSIRFLKEDSGTILSAYILMNAISQGLEEEQIQDVYNKFHEDVKKSALGKILQQEVDKMNIKELTVGEAFRDLTMQTPDGTKISISDYVGKGKYVLLDFWASWCGPCRGENPNVVALYNAYKDKGFEIVGISLDQDKEAWIQGIKEDKISWPQMSDLKGWNSEATIKYKIQGIPFTVLLDKEGKVIETNLRGDGLKNKIKALIP